MKRLVGLFIFGIFIFGCAKDIIVEPPSNLRGAYTGTYQVIWNYGSGGGGTTGPKTEEQNIDWTFTDYTFRMTVPEGDTTQITNNCSGNYTVGNKMVFTVVYKEPGSFNPKSLPEGEFDFITIKTEGAKDTLRFTQLSGEATSQIYKTINLIKTTQ
jgi:hypothetical protein